VNLPFDEGIKVERELFRELVTGTQSAAQRYVFFAERQVWKVPDVPESTPTIPVNKVGIIGAGTMGGGIAMNFANVGVPVTIVETQQAALDRGWGSFARTTRTRPSAAASTRGRRDAHRADRGTLALEELADCDLIIEAVFENMAVKKEIFASWTRSASRARSSPPTHPRSTSTRSPPR
jgi:3-hydroxyacyl-CoA dehydrogenase